MFLVISETESDMKIILKDQQNFLQNFPMNLIIYLFRNAFFLMRLSIQSQNFQSSGNSIILKISFMISLVYYLLSAATFRTTTKTNCDSSCFLQPWYCFKLFYKCKTENNSNYVLLNIQPLFQQYPCSTLSMILV